MFKPLEGIKVIDCSLAGSGPACTKLLVEYGAEDIWVEPLHGASTRLVHKFDFYTTGKRALAINLKTEAGQEVMQRLVEHADVFITNYRPKALERLHLDADTLCTLNPRLIYGSITGYGPSGPDADKPGYDTIAFWSKGGLLQDIAERGTLVVPPISIGDITTGTNLASGILAALLNRERTGQGCRVSTSLYANAIYLNHDAEVEVQYGELYPKSRKEPRRALSNTYRCKDNRWLTITIIPDFAKYFPRLLKAVGREDLIGDPRWKCAEDTMHDHAPELVRILDEAFGRMTRAEALKALEAEDVPVCPVQSTADTLRDPQAVENGYYLPLEATVPPRAGQEKILVPATPVRFSLQEPDERPAGRGPKLGEHSAEILKEYGFSEAEIGKMLEQNVVFQNA